MPLLSSFARRYQRRAMLPRLVSSQPLIVSRIQRTQRKVQRLQPQRMLRSGSVAGPPREHSAAQRPMVWQGEPVEQGPTPAEQQLSVLRRHLTRQGGSGRDRARPPQRRARRSQEDPRAAGQERSSRRMPGRQGQQPQRTRRTEPAEIEEPPARPSRREQPGEPRQARSEQAEPLAASEAEAERGDDIHRAETVWTGDQAEVDRSESPRETRRTEQSERPAVGPHKPIATEPTSDQPDHERAEFAPEPSTAQGDDPTPTQPKPPLEEVVQRSSQPTRRAADSDPGELQPPLNQPPRRPQQETADGPAITHRETEPAPRGDVPDDRPGRRETSRTMGTRSDRQSVRSLGEGQQRRTPQRPPRQPDSGPEAEQPASADQEEVESAAVGPQASPPWSRAETQLASDPTEHRPTLEEMVNAQASDGEIQRAPAEAPAEAQESEPPPPVQRAQAPAPARSGPEPVEAGAQGDEEGEQGQDLDVMAQQVFHLLRRRLKVEAERAQGGRL